MKQITQTKWSVKTLISQSWWHVLFILTPAFTNIRMKILLKLRVFPSSYSVFKAKTLSNTKETPKSIKLRLATKNCPARRASSFCTPYGEVSVSTISCGPDHKGPLHTIVFQQTVLPQCYKKAPSRPLVFLDKSNCKVILFSSEVNRKMQFKSQVSVHWGLVFQWCLEETMHELCLFH